ncbi:MAG: amidophosphoribosyltransferase [Halobacteriota archaeon]|nr:amidophosphoribosyltransferase [Halobacteriota archaeon]
MIEGCGVVGVALDEPKEPSHAALSLFYALYSLQHRGQESAGIAVRKDEKVHLIKEMGLVPEVFNRQNLKELEGNVGVGHVRYSTTGESRIENSQPLLINHKSGSIALAHNGNLVNSEELRMKIESEGGIFLSTSDTEIIAHLLVRELMKADYAYAIGALMKQLVGSYSLTILIDDTLIAVRDPLGLKPLCYGKIEGGYIVASESAAIDTLKGEFIRDIKPGEVLIFDGYRPVSHRIFKPQNTAHCVFEYIYFARPDSIIDGKIVYDVRRRIGETLVEEHDVEVDVVSPVPDSGVTSAIGYAKASGVDYMESLIKNRYSGRTFILPSQYMRDIAVRLKLNAVSSNVKEKRIALIDDSIVRGTTSRRIIDSLRSGGAKEIHARFGSPPIISPCYLGIDMATRDELIAAHNSIEDVGRMINADSIGYVSIDGLVKSIGIPAENLCMGCLTEVYPVNIPGEKCAIRQLTLAQF